MNKKRKQKRKGQVDMLHGSLADKIILFALPLAASSILQQLFNSADVAVAGRFAGSEALAAVGGNSPVINLIVNLFVGFSIGANVVIVSAIGQGNKKRANRAVHTVISLALVCGIALIFIGNVVAAPILEMMDTPEKVLPLAVVYLRIYFCGMPFFMMYNYGAAILRAVGDTKRPLIFLIVSGVINAVLNLFLVIGFHLDVAGVGIATVISQLVSCILVLRCLHHTESSYQLHLAKLRIRSVYLKQIFEVGVPAGIQSTVINISNAMLQSSVNSFGSIAMAGYTASNNIFGFLYVSVNSFTQACMSFTSQNYGVKKLKRMDRVLIDCMILSVVVTLILGSSVYIFGPELLHIYSNQADVITYGMEIFSYTTVTYFLCGLMDLFPGALRGMGYSTVPMILSIIGTVGVRIIWIYGLFPSHRSLTFLFLSYPVSWIATIIMQVICFWFVRKKIHRTMVIAAE